MKLWTVFSLLLVFRVQAQVDSTEKNIPIPSGLSKTGSTETTLTLRFLPPPRYLTDERFTHFRVEYKPFKFNNQWKIFEMPKIADANNVVLRNLFRGILYEVRIRSQRRDAGGKIVLSNSSDSILARTKPYPVSQLSVVRSQTEWDNVIVSWIEPPIEAFGNKYEETVLNYYIKKESLPENIGSKFQCYDAVSDVAFLIDGSSSVGSSGFASLRDYLYDIVSRFDNVGENGVSVAIIQYSYEPRIELAFRQSTDQPVVLNSIRNLKYLNGNARTGFALDFLKDLIDDQGRPNASKVAIVITDGRSQSDVRAPSLSLRNDGVIMFAIGVGNAEEINLNEIASSPQSQYVYKVDDYVAISNIKDDLIQKICKQSNGQYQNFSQRFEKLFPPKNLTFKTPSLLASKNDNTTTSLSVVPGAPYRYEVVTKSLGDDETTSDVTFVDKTLEIPGPINLKKTAGNQTSLNISWEQRPGVTNTTGYQVTWSEDRSDERFELTINRTEVELSPLKPGSRYTVLVKSMQNHRFFGKLSEESFLRARTDPSTVREVKTTLQSSTTLGFNFSTPLGSLRRIVCTYQTADGNIAWKEVTSTIDNQVLLVNLQPGALYNVNFTVLSEPNPQTSTSYIKLARTNPIPPTDLRARSERGTIYLSWRAPNIYPQSRWHYNVTYYPLNMKNETKTLCQIRGQAFQKISLPDLKSGIGYSISVKTVAGEDCDKRFSSSYPTYSISSKKIIAYTQPDYPTINFWKQVTVNSVRVVWSMPSNEMKSMFDAFVVGVRRLRNSKSFIAYEKEDFLIKVPKDQLSLVLRLTQGAYYRINVTTQVGSGNSVQKSVVIPKTNSVQVYVWHRYYDQFPFPRLEWKFRTCGRSGRFGPSQVLCDSYYSDRSLNQLVEINQGIQTWIAPLSGLYRIVAAGAGYEGPGGLGAIMSSVFFLEEGSVLKIGVGQRGKQLGAGMSIGGGGGSFVVYEIKETSGLKRPDKTEVLVVAGGAGSSPDGLIANKVSNARLNDVAGNASQVGNEFGRGGIAEGEKRSSGKRGILGTGGGAGFYGIADFPAVLGNSEKSFPAVGFQPFVGGSQSFNESERKKNLPLSGGRYEISKNRFSEGGFGGGGSGYLSAAGGGGGYSGGGGGPSRGYSGGGGSFIKPSGGKDQREVGNSQPGFVTISVIGLPSTSPVPVMNYLIISFFCGVLFVVLCGAGLYLFNRCVGKYCPGTSAARDRYSKRSQSFDMAAFNTSTIVPSNAEKKTVDRQDSFFSSDDVVIVPEGSFVQESSFQESNPWKSVLDKYEGLYSDSNSDSLSTVSSVSSMATSFNKNKFKFDESNRNTSNRGEIFSQITDSDLEFERDAEQNETYFSSGRNHGPDFAPSDSPPEFRKIQQKEEFQKKLKKFQNLRKNRKTENRSKSPVVFSTIEV